VGRVILVAGARPWFLPPYTPDPNPIKRAFAMITHWMQHAQKRAVEQTWRHIGHFVADLEPDECINYFVYAGYASTQT
jgi:transposase